MTDPLIRPLNKLKADRGIDYTLITANSTGRLNPYDFEEAFKPNTKLVCLTHASNVIGNINPVEEVGALCAKKGIAFLVDTAQTAGVIPIDMKTMNIDFLAFTGHKGLMGPPGTGGLAVSAKWYLDSFIEGGTGSNRRRSERPNWPTAMPPRCIGARGPPMTLPMSTRTGVAGSWPMWP